MSNLWILTEERQSLMLLRMVETISEKSYVGF